MVGTFQGEGQVKDGWHTQLAVAPMVLPTVVNVLLALLPRVVMAAMHTTMMSASMTAYSTAVGPSSRFRNRTTLLANFLTTMPPKAAGSRNPSDTPTLPARSYPW